MKNLNNMNRQFCTEELGIIRDVLKQYTNEHVHDFSLVEENAIKLVWNKVKHIHIKQKREDQELFENFFRNY